MLQVSGNCWGRTDLGAPTDVQAQNLYAGSIDIVTPSIINGELVGELSGPIKLDLIRKLHPHDFDALVAAQAELEEAGKAEPAS